MQNTVDVLGVRISKVNMQEAVEIGKKLLQSDGKHNIFTPNPEIIWMAQKDSDLKVILNEATLLLPDGVGVVIASRTLKDPLEERVAGYDFIHSLLPETAALGKDVFLFGSKPGVAEQAAQKLCEQYPGLTVAGTRSGYFKEDETDDIIEDINKSGADLLIVCLGAPKQEKWIYQHRSRLTPSVTIGAGGALDVISGNTDRAPRFMQKIGLEWLYRIIREPKRIPRAMALPRFMWSVRRQARLDRKMRNGAER